MTNKTKVFVTLAIIGAIGYTIDILLGLLDGGFRPSMFMKIILIAAFLYYAIKNLKGRDVVK